MMLRPLCTLWLEVWRPPPTFVFADGRWIHFVMEEPMWPRVRVSSSLHSPCDPELVTPSLSTLISLSLKWD